MLKQLFWDSEYRRLRTLWRLLLHLVILVVTIFVGSALLGIVATYLLTGEVNYFAGLDPTGIGVSPQTLPFLNNVSTVTTAALIVISIWLAGRWLDRRRFADFGVHLSRTWWLDFAFGLGLGALLMLLIFLTEWAAGWITIEGAFRTASPQQSFAPALITPIITFVCVGIYEELLSRGYHLKNMAEGFSGLGHRGAVILATLLSSSIFGLLHASNPNATAFSTFNIFLAGIFLALGYLLTGELAISIGLHMTWNFFQGNVFGFPVSGTQASPATVIAIRQAGDPLITGGAFGPEAGLIGIAAMIIGSLLIVAWVRLRTGTVRLHPSLTVPDLRRPLSGSAAGSEPVVTPAPDL